MSQKMQAVRILEMPIGKKPVVRLQEVDIPTFGDNEVLIKVYGAAICGSDKHIYEGLLRGDVDPSPLTMGHEFAGEIAGVGKNVKNCKIGDRVTCELQVNYCGTCKVCHSGNTHLCAHKNCPGLDMDGAYAQYITMPANMVHHLEDTVSYIAAACIEPAAIVATCILERAPIRPEENVVIFGAGPLGLIALQMCKAVGARQVIVVETFNKIRAEKAKELGADYVITDPNEDVAKKVFELTDNFGADYAIELAGAEEALNNCIKCLHKNGRIALIGVPAGMCKVNLYSAVIKALTLHGTYASTSSAWDKVISMIARGALNLETLVTHTFELADFEKAFEVLSTEGAVKVVFTPNK